MRMPVSSATPHSPPTASNTGSNTWDFLDAGSKRKRDTPADAVDFTQSTIAFPWVGQPKNQSTEIQPHTRGHESRDCSKCRGQSQPPGAPLVTCFLCVKSWHQQCLFPAFTGDASWPVSFVCSACQAEGEEGGKLKGKVSQQRRGEIERLRQTRLATLPQGVAPAKSGVVGFGAGRASDSSRTEYFSDMKKTDLLNILSLCDQLKPQLLTDILVSVSKKHPDLPIFKSPDWETELPSAQRPAKPSKPIERPRHGHVIMNGKTRLKVNATKKILKRTRVIEVVTDMPGEEEDVLPPTWRKANEGIYAKLVPDTEDDSLLADVNDEESFSHFMVDSFGKQIVEAVGG
ncbi:hypothetical protein AK830_g2683 [Neonectria ditissima]|uniref:Zinc finger PHD-type domain-containing protein n=1 Tax=Neonectria ditissima TaxID=78410 RepID=A0A0N8H886_9HYPO|nr:hypothetical protein AK830_g2683 [Neonectria ditissima]